MLNLKNFSTYFALVLLTVFLTGTIRPADAEPWRPRSRMKKKVHVVRHPHYRDYPAPGGIIRTLPRGTRVVVHAGNRYHYFGGIWYRPHRSRFIVTVPPVGVIVPYLPPYYSIIWVGSRPFYYANDIYYSQSGDGYVVVPPPEGDVSKVVPSSSQMFIYPSKGQSQEQQADDRYACHSWAVKETNYDPTRLDGEKIQGDKNQARADYQRAMGACLEARGYSVK